MFDFPDTVEKIDDVPEEFRGLYSEGDEGFQMVDPLRKKIGHTSSLTEAIEKERKRVSNAQRELAQFKEFADTPDGVKDAIAAAKAEAEAQIADLKKMLDEKGDATQKFEKWKSEAEEKTAKAVKEADEKVGVMEKTLNRYLIESEAKSAIASAKGNVKVLLPHVTAATSVIKEGDDFIVRVLDEDGDPRGDGKGGYLNIAGLINEMRSSDDFAGCFEADNRGGSGTPPAGQQRAGGKGQTFSLSDWQRKVSSATSDERQQLLRDKAEGRVRVA